MAATRFSCQLVLASSGTEAPSVQARRSGEGREEMLCLSNRAGAAPAPRGGQHMPSTAFEGEAPQQQ